MSFQVAKFLEMTVFELNINVLEELIMPKKKVSKSLSDRFLKQTEGKYGIFSNNLHKMYTTMILGESYIGTENNQLFQRYNEYADGIAQETYTLDEPTKLFRGSANTIKLKNVGGSPEVIEGADDLTNEMLNKKDEQIANAKGIKEELIPLFNLQKIPAKYDAGDYATAYNESLYLPRLIDIIGVGLKSTIKVDVLDDDGNVIGKEIDYETIVSNLKKPDGRGFFAPYMEICDATVRLTDAEVFKAKCDRLGWTAEDRKKYNEMVYAAQKDFVKSFDELKATVDKYEDIYTPYTENQPSHMTNYARDHNSDVDIMRYEIMGYEKGFNMEEATLLGLVGFIMNDLESGKKNLAKETGELEKDVKNVQKQIENAKKQLEELKNKAEANKGVVEIFENQHADTVKKYEDYKKQLDELTGKYNEYEKGLDQLDDIEDEKERTEAIEKYKADNKSYKEELDKLIADNKDIVSKYKNYETILESKTFSTAIKNKTSELNGYEANLKKHTEFLNINKKAREEYPKLESKVKDLDRFIKEFDIKNNYDKKIVYGEVKRFFESNGDYVVKAKGLKLSTLYSTEYADSLNKIGEILTTGITDDIKASEEAKTKMQYVLDIYGPNPKYHEEWEKANVFKKDDFEDSVGHGYDSNELPFTDRELAILSMAGTLSAKDEIMVRFDNPEQDFESVVLTQSTKWLNDTVLDTNGPRAGLNTYKDIIVKGKAIASDAVDKYAEGDKSKVAELIYNSLYVSAHRSS